MFRKGYKLLIDWIEIRRFKLLLISTLFVLILPSLSHSIGLADLLFVITMTFLFVQSMVAADNRKSKRKAMHYVVLTMIILTWLKPIGIDSFYLNIGKMLAFITFFGFVVNSLVRYMAGAENVSVNVLLASVTIYLLMGIIGAFLALLMHTLYPGSYIFPAHIREPQMVNFLYYSFITMTTVGYGDIIPAIPESQTLAFLLAVTGQLYVAIIIAFLVGKLLAHKSEGQ